MRAQGWAGGAPLPWGWPAGEVSSPSRTETPFNWRRLCFGEKPKRTLYRILAWASCILLTFQYMLVPIKVTGASMAPTYRDGSVNFINRLSYAHKSPHRGDVVILRDGEDMILKRVIALPGERVELDRGVFKINGVALADRFTADPINWDLDPVTLGPDEYFVIGDNRTASMFGKFQRQQIVGKIFF